MKNEKNTHTGTHLLFRATFIWSIIIIMLYPPIILAGTDGNLRNLRNLKAKKIRCRC